MKILVLNSGSSSLKYQLFDMPAEQSRCSGLVDRIGLEYPSVTHKIYTGDQEKVVKYNSVLLNHETALLEVSKILMDEKMGIISNPDEIEIVGHRIVHGGESFSATMVIDEKVKAEINKLFSLAPLHNPSNYKGIEVSEKIFTKARQVAVFDTAFHQAMPEKAFRFAIPDYLYTQEGIRAYGFHGTSHKYVSEKAAAYLNNPEAKIISIHLGNGCSMAAVRGGTSIDTSMGFGPNSGLVMGTRSGDIDPSVIFHLINNLGYSADEVNNLLNKKSGMLGLTGYSDMREIFAAVEEGDERAKLAYDIYVYRIKKYIGSFISVLNGLDAIIFTAGVGENDVYLRKSVCKDMDYFGIHLDYLKNGAISQEIREVNNRGSKVKVLVIPTNEEFEIARQCYYTLNK